jgi:hypothetical protein
MQCQLFPPSYLKTIKISLLSPSNLSNIVSTQVSRSCYHLIINQKKEDLMKRIKLYHFVILLLVGSVIVFGCQKDSAENPFENGLTPELKNNSGPQGYALQFDGEDDYVMVPDADHLDLTDAFTIVAWIKIETYFEWASIVTKGGQLDGNNYTIHQSGPMGGSDVGYLRFTGDNPNLPISPYLESSTQIPLNEWHFVALTWDGENLKFYFDGEEDGGGALEGPMNTNDEPLHIGVDFPGGDEYWHGLIDEVRIWNIALAPKFIRVAMNGRATPKSFALVGHWAFEEGTGNVAEDWSDYENDGQLMGDPQFVMYP